MGNSRSILLQGRVEPTEILLIRRKEKWQQTMKDVNAYYKKHKNLDECDLINEEEKTKILRWMNNWSFYDVPYAPYNLQNNNAEIRRNKQI